MDPEQYRIYCEQAVRLNPNNTEAIRYLAHWHLERQSYHQAKKYFTHLVTLQHGDFQLWISIAICCALADELDDCKTAIMNAQSHDESTMSKESEIRLTFCQVLIALLLEKKKEFNAALELYSKCLQLFEVLYKIADEEEPEMSEHSVSISRDSSENSFGKTHIQGSSSQPTPISNCSHVDESIYNIKGEIYLRIAMTNKECNNLDQATIYCDYIINDSSYCKSLQANSMLLKGVLLELKNDLLAAESLYRVLLTIVPSHYMALERLGRIYLRYTDAIPHAVQYFFRAVEANPSSATLWYLLGRCYTATAQYSDAFEAYYRAINLNPNDPKIWSSLGVLYFAHGQYYESLGMFARAVRLDINMPETWYNIGALYDIVNQPNDAQQAYIIAKKFGYDELFRTGDTSYSMANPLGESSSLALPVKHNIDSETNDK